MLYLSNFSVYVLILYVNYIGGSTVLRVALNRVTRVEPLYPR